MYGKKIIEPGKWFNEFDENGLFKAAGYDASYYRVLGFRPGELVINEFGDWTERIHPEDVPRVVAYAADVVSKHPEGMDYDIEYRLMTKWGYHWFHDYGFCTRRADGSLARCDGVLFDIQDSVEKDDMRREQIAKMAGGVSAYIVDPETEHFQVISRNEYLAENYPDAEDFNTSFSKYIATDVLDADREMVAEKISISAIRKHLETESEYIVRYRDISAGYPRWFEMRAVKLSETEILCGFSDKDGELIDRLLFEKLRENYFGLYYVNLDSGFAQILKTGHPEITGEAGSALPYVSVIKSIADSSEGETAAFLNRLCDVDYLNACFAEDDLVYHAYKSFIFDGNRWVNVTGLVLGRHADGTPSIFSLGFSLLDEVACEKEEAGQKLAESMEVVGGLASEYTALYHVNLDTGDYVPYHLIREVSDIRPYYEKNTKFVDLAREFAKSSLVHPDDREALLAFYPSDEAVREALKDRKKISVLFKRNYGGKFLWTEAGIIKSEAVGEEAHNVVVGFVEKEREIREQTELIRATEEENRLIDSIVSNYEAAYLVNIADDVFRLLRMNTEIIGEGDVFGHFSETREGFLEKRVHPADRARMANELDYAAIRRKLAEARSYTVEYRALVKGATVWHEMNITEISGDEVTVGFAAKDLEITRRHIEEKRFEEYLALFEVDLDTEMIKPLKTSLLFKTAGVGDAVPYGSAMRLFAASYTGDAGRFFAQFSDPAYVRQELAVEDKRTFSFKSAKLAGDKWIDAVSYVTKRHEDGTPAMFTLGFSIVDALATLRQELQERLAADMKMIGGLASGYESLYYVDLDDGSFKPYSLDEERRKIIYRVVGENGSFFDMLSHYGRSGLVHPDEMHVFRKLSAATFRKWLTHAKKFTVRYRRNFNGEYRWSEMEVIKFEDIDKPAHTVAVGFANRDAEIRSEQTLRNCLRLLGRELPPQEAIDELLSLSGEFYGAKRCYVFEYDRKNGIFRNTFEWCAAGVEPMISQLQSIPLKEVEGWNREFERQGAFYMDALDSEHNTPEGREILAMQGIGSLIAAPIMNGDEIMGFVGVDDPTKAKTNLPVLKTVAAIAYSKILQRRENDEEHVTLGKLTEAFVSVYYVDLSADYMRTWKIAEEYKEAYGSVKNYSVSMGGYVRSHIAERDRERCIRMTSPEYVLGQFKSKDRFSIGMTDIMLGYERDFVFDYIKVSEDGTRLVVCCRDVTESLAKEKEQQRLLEEARSAAESASRSKTEFLFNMSHDIRTPMNAITGFTNMAIKHIDDREKALDCMSKIQQSGNMLLSLINSVLEVSRIESGHATLDEQPGDVYFSFVNIETTMRELAEAKDISLSIEFGNIRNRYVYCDFSRCIRVLVNVISNAIKYTREGGFVKTRCEQLTAAENGIAVYRYTVEDNGIGMSEEFQQHIFEQFSREKTATVSGIQGTGLGMAVVKSFVDLMGGTIGVKSKQGEGSRFTIDLPFRIQEGAAYTDPVTGEILAAGEKRSTEIEASFAGKTVLLVEDNELNREIATEILEEEGLMVEEACDGSESVALLREKGPKYYDFILMDIQMPVMDGYEATQAIRAMYPDAGIPIIALSANAFAEDKQKSLAAGMDDHVAKPINVKDLLSALARFL